MLVARRKSAFVDFGGNMRIGSTVKLAVVASVLVLCGFGSTGQASGVGLDADVCSLDLAVREGAWICPPIQPCRCFSLCAAGTGFWRPVVYLDMGGLGLLLVCLEQHRFDGQRQGILRLWIDSSWYGHIQCQNFTERSPSHVEGTLYPIKHDSRP